MQMLSSRTTILNNMPLFTTTVAAISTPPGKGGVAVIRISGPDARSVCERVFCPMGSTFPQDAPRMAVYGKIMSSGKVIDDGIAVFFPRNNSYTGEDTVELSCHGGILISRAVLEACFIAGATPAGAGEFTKRAFVNGRITLSDADAIGLMLDAESDGQLKLAGSAARDKLNRKIEDIRVAITNMLSSIFARIDYPDEDLGELSDKDTLNALYRVRDSLGNLISTYKTGRAIREGISTSIVGSPNAGKSTLYNLLGGDDAAIVTDIPGTTRDVLERSISLGDVMLRIADTAGIRSTTDDPIECIGIERSRQRMAQSELVLALFDASRPFTHEDLDLISIINKTTAVKIAVLTKSDLADEKVIKENEATLQRDFKHIITVSAIERDEEAIKILSNKVSELFTDGTISLGDDAVVSSARQHASLVSALGFITSAIGAYEAGLPQDISSSDIELALGAISEIDGRAVSEAVVADIFSKFCVGK